MNKKITSTEQMLRHIGTLADKMKSEVYVVGGYLRDKLLGYNVKDIDFTVIIDGIGFARTVADSLGVSNIVCYEMFGTCMIPYKDYKLEFVQARSETYEPDSRKPNVAVGDLYTDLQRRDFTVNTLAQRLTKKGPTGELINLFNGLDDLENKILKTPLDPNQTFEDDPLRMIRAVRFVACFGFNLHRSALRAMIAQRERIKIVSQERVANEFVHIMRAEIPSTGLDLLRVTGLLEILYPDLYQLIGVDQRGTYHHKDVWFHTLKVVDNVAKVSDKLPLRLAALYHDIAKPKTKRFVENTGWTFHGHDALGANMVPSIIKRLRLPREIIPYIRKLIRLHLRPINLSNEGVTDSAIRRLVVAAGNDLEDLLTLCRADITSGNPARVERHLKNFDIVEKRIKEVEELDALRTFQSPVNGNEIMEVCGLKPSPLIGKIKSVIEEAILDGIIRYDHDAAYDYLLQIKDEILRNASENNAALKRSNGVHKQVKSNN